MILLVLIQIDGGSLVLVELRLFGFGFLLFTAVATIILLSRFES